MQVVRRLRSLFLREPESLEDLLTELNDEIRKLESQRSSDINTQKNLIFKFFLYSFLAYSCIFIFVFCFYWPENTLWKVVFFSSIFMYLLFLFLLRFLFRAFFVRRVKYKDTRLKELRKKKDAILDGIMETEPYNKVQNLLKHFEPSRLGMYENQQQQRQKLNQGQLQRVQPNQTESKNPSTSVQYARPILPRDRSIFEKLIDACVGDGANNRYALICTHCNSHNGMALEEEFEYLAFKCCYCKEQNPARKKRATAPHPPNVLNESSLNESASEVKVISSKARKDQ